MHAYYNENDPFAAAWLRGLIAAGLIAPGFVDERDIRDVRPGDLEGFTRYHFFAGIGGWDYALQLAGWDAGEPVWTGSCPCQPFSSAGKGEGFNDPRHLWPAWFRLIRECRPSVVLGEQVASKDGTAWLDHVATDFEAEAYAVGAADMGAASVGAPHIRQRLWFVADSGRAGDERWRGPRDAHGQAGADQETWHQWERCGPDAGDSVEARGVADDTVKGRGAQQERPAGEDRREHGQQQEDGGPGDRLGDPTSGGLGIDGSASGSPRHAHESGSPWSDLVWLPCRDGKARPTKPGLFPLAHGISGRLVVGGAVQPPAATLSPEQAARVVSRVGVLRGAGNAIVPQVAAVFIRAYLEGQGVA